jgi:phage/plasmid primase-like uncharacterized protein
MLAMTASSQDFNTARAQMTERALPLRFRDAASQFRAACDEFGLSPESVSDTGGRIVRCPTQSDKPGRKSGWYIFFDDGLPAGEFGDWRTSECRTWCAKPEPSMSAAELERLRYQREQARIAREADRIQRAVDAAQSAREKWDKAEDATAHPYLEKKGVRSFGLKLLGGKLLIPLFDADGAIHGLQKIDSTGEKRFTFGCEKKGKFFVLPGQGKTAVCEGYATAASVHMATGWTTLVAFDAGNLVSVASAWRETHPDDPLVICGDADDAGRKGAQACGLPMLFPPGEGMDWNDVHTRDGLEALMRMLTQESRAFKVRIEDWRLKAEDFITEPEPRKDLVENLLPMGSVMLWASLGGSGKSLALLNLGVDIAQKEPDNPEQDFNIPRFCGNRITEHGPVVIYTAEDSGMDVKRRVFSLRKRFPHYPLHVVSLLNAIGPYPFVLPGNHDGPTTSEYWNETREQLLALRPRLVVFDPLASFALVDLNKPEVANYTMSLFANLAIELDACIIVSHHLAKTKDNVTTPEQARSLVRGSTALVDRTRGTYVLWALDDKRAKEICATIGEEWQREKVYQGCLAKENFGGDKRIRTFVRAKNGLLTVCDDRIRESKDGRELLVKDALVEAIAAAAEALQPFTKSGTNGLVARRSELPDDLKDIGRPTMEKLVESLLDEGRIVLCIPIGGTTKNRLDVPDGPIARAVERIQPGAKQETTI